MSIKSTHPQYDAGADAIAMLRDFYAGAAKVKGEGEKYLPAPESVAMFRDTDSTRYTKAYDAYKTRAEVPAYVGDAVDRMVGVMHAKPPSFGLPERLAYLVDDATGTGIGLADLLRSVNAEQLLSGRVGLALDAGKSGPVLRLYYAEAIRNWSHAPGGYQWVILGEPADVIDDFKWTTRDGYRLLKITEGRYSTSTFGPQGEDLTAPLEPSIAGRALGVVPFVAINCSDTAPDMDKPPLLPLAEKCAAIYRASADHKLNLHMQSASTLVIAGLARDVFASEDGAAQQKIRVGAGGYIQVDIGGDAKYAQPGADGLGAQQADLDAMHAHAAQLGVDILGNAGAGESGDALNVRVAARTSSLVQIARAGAAGLEQILRIAADWIGADRTEVSVTVDTDYQIASATPADALAMAQAKIAGFPVSKRSMHWWAQQKRFTPLDYDAEMDEIANEGP